MADKKRWECELLDEYTGKPTGIEGQTIAEDAAKAAEEFAYAKTWSCEPGYQPEWHVRVRPADTDDAWQTFVFDCTIVPEFTLRKPAKKGVSGG